MIHLSLRKRILASGWESLFPITDSHPQAALSDLVRSEFPFPIPNFLLQSLPSALRGLNGDFDPMRASGIASAGQQSSRFRKSVHSLRLRAGEPVSTGLCKRRAKPESGPRETGRRRSSEGNSRPACPFRRDFASAGRSPKAVPEKRVAAAAARETMAVRETAVHRKAGIQAAAPQAQRASSPTCSQSLQPNMQSIPAAQPVALPSASPGSACLGCRSGA